MLDFIPYNKPHVTGDEFTLVKEAIEQGHLAGDGSYTKSCQEAIEDFCDSDFALITNSCTAALETAAILADISQGDEVIMPSYTFSSTANAIVLRGGVPVFIDIRDDTLNMDQNLLETALTKNTKAIMPVHYAGVACEMDTIMQFSDEHRLLVIEDAAQGFLSSYKGKALGTIGDFGCLSFHETKNIISGEGGALLLKDENKKLQAEIIREKGTDRSQFIRGEIDKYTWNSVGSSYLPSEIVSAFLLAQLKHAKAITQKRLEIWNYYFKACKPLEEDGFLSLPVIPKNCTHTAHIFYVILDERFERSQIISKLREFGVHTVSHYTPLHSAPAGRKYGRTPGPMQKTINASKQIIRLPLWAGMTMQQQEQVIEYLALSLKNG